MINTMFDAKADIFMRTFIYLFSFPLFLSVTFLSWLSLSLSLHSHYPALFLSPFLTQQLSLSGKMRVSTLSPNHKPTSAK